MSLMSFRGCRSCLGCDEFWQADQIVAGHRQGELEAELLDAPKHGPRKPADRLAPAERLLDALSLPLAHRIAGMPCGTGIDRGTSSADVLCDMWRHVECAHVGDECCSVVTLVGAQGDATSPGRVAHDHLFGSLSLSGTGRLGQRGRDDQSAAVFHQRVAHEAKLGFLAPSLAIKLRLGIRGRGVRGVAALLAVKVALAIAARAPRPVPTPRPRARTSGEST